MRPTNRFFSIVDIAHWALTNSDKYDSGALRVHLPALQRGAVWSVQQVERLWDSLVRGFPIGSLILAEERQHLGSKPFATQVVGPNGPVEGGHLLLDGQQRSTAIALGFLDPWRNPDHGRADFALWVDLEAPPPNLPNDYVFRLLTRSHPWGYQRQNPGERLSTSARRLAMQEFEASAKRLGLDKFVFRPGHLPIGNAWPYDVRTPIPLIFILDTIYQSEEKADDRTVWDNVRKSLAALDNHVDWVKGESPEGTHRQELGERLLKAVRAPTPHMNRLIAGLRQLMAKGDGGLHIPAQWLPNEHIGSAPSEAQPVDREDPVLTLFVRINTAGTQPNAEELAYSVLKSVMPECRGGIEDISRQFMPPARMVLLLSTLTLTNLAEQGGGTAPPAFPDINRFRRLVQGADTAAPDFRGRLQTFLTDGRAHRTIEAAHRLLVIDPLRSEERPWRLLPLQAARIAQNHEQAFLLLLVWVQSRLFLNSEDKWLGLDEAGHRRLVGLMCVLGWFGASGTNTASLRRKYLLRLWKNRYDLHQPGAISELIKAQGTDENPIIPLPPPKILTLAVERCVTGIGFKGYSTQHWQQWDFWKNFRYRLDDIPAAKQWYQKVVKPCKINGDAEPQSRVAERIENSWDFFITKTINNTELVLYAQRRSLSKWYPEFDPTTPVQLQDTEQPWDIDHIHPQNYVQGRHNIPPLITAWHSTIGNLRAWPSEINRSQHDLDPANKIGHPNDQEKINYGLSSAADLRAASAILEPKDWEESYPNNDGYVPGHYLRNGDPEALRQTHRQALVRAISSRYVALYAEWYKELRIRELG